MWIPRLEHESSGLHFWVASTFICWAFLNYTLCTLMLVNLLAWNSPWFFLLSLLWLPWCKALPEWRQCSFSWYNCRANFSTITNSVRLFHHAAENASVLSECFTWLYVCGSLFSPHPHAHLATTSASVSCPCAHSCSVTPSPRVTQDSHGLFLCPAGLLLSFRVPLTQPFSISVSRPLAPMPCCCPISRLRWSDSHSTHHHLT